jgi:transposase
VERADAAVIYDAGREVVIDVLLRMDRQIRVLTAQVERQGERIAALEAKLAANSRNSSRPPSTDRPGKAPKRAAKDLSPRKPGGQSGHQGHGRELLPIAAVDEVVEHWPLSCGCGHLFTERERVAVGPVARHQIEELPRLAVRVIEHQCPRVSCPDCGGQPRAELPPDVAGSAFGPRFQAAVAALVIRNRVSRLDAVELLEELFGARISTGAIEAILTRTGDALQEPCRDLLEQVQASAALNIDETGWRLKGVQRALWGAFTDRLAVFRIAADRHEDHARALLNGHQGVVTSDRWWAYNHLPLARRQVCWSHLRRDFQAQAESLDAQAELGNAGLQVCETVFTAFQAFQDTNDRAELRRCVRAAQRELKPILRRYSGKAPRNKRTRGLARNLLKVWPALWTFARIPGVTPTNNHAERGLRGAVIARKLSLGSQSTEGETRTTRLLAASVTCRLQRRSLFDYLTELHAAHSAGAPLPLLT